MRPSDHSGTPDRPTPKPIDEAVIVTKAVGRLAERFGIQNSQLARVLGLSEATISRLRHGQYQLDRHGKPFELALLLIRVMRAVEAICGQDPKAAASWLTSENQALGGRPIDLVQTVDGLTRAVLYVDARRAPL
jgi:hypothetical protein